jgi:hypothetical protein
MNYRSYQFDEPVIQPMYYRNPEESQAYRVSNQYYFGSDMIVAPVTEKCIEHVNRAKVSLWLPEGIYIDFFTYMIYEGNRVVTMYRDKNHIPVLVRSGTILPMTNKVDDTSFNPKNLSIKVFAGDDGRFELYEDDNETCNYENGICAITEFRFRWNGTKSFRILPVRGEVSLIPQCRSYEVEFVGCSYSNIRCEINGQRREVKTETAAAGMKVVIADVRCTDDVLLLFDTVPERKGREFHAQLLAFLDQAECEYELKDTIFMLSQKRMSRISFMNALQSFDIDPNMLGCISEIASAIE